MYVYTGHDEAEPGQNQFVMREWHVFSSDAPAPEPEAWTHHGSPLSLEDFAWADANAWGERGRDRSGRPLLLVRLGRRQHRSGLDEYRRRRWDGPTGPFTDAIGVPLIRDDMPNSSALNIDPSSSQS